MRRIMILVVGLCTCLVGWGQTAFSYRYWFDQSTDVYIGTAEEPECHFDVDVSHLSDGLHWLYVQVGNAEGDSSVRSRLFAKCPRPEDTATLECRIYVDGELWKGEEVQCKGGEVAWTLDVSHLPIGLHRYTLQTVTPQGIGATLREGFFLRTALQTEVEALKLYYTIDNGDVQMASPASASDGIYDFSLDVSSLSEGEHQLTYWLANGTNLSTDLMYATFTKVPDDTGVESLELVTSTAVNGIFDLNGRRIVNSKLSKGVNIVRMSEGTTKKVLSN